MPRFAIFSVPERGNRWVPRILRDTLGIEENAQLGAGTLLSNSYHRLHDPASVLSRYEEGVARVEKAYYGGVHRLSLPPHIMERALMTRDLCAFQALSNKNSCQGKLGLWRLLPFRHPQPFFNRHESLLDTLGCSAP